MFNSILQRYEINTWLSDVPGYQDRAIGLKVEATSDFLAKKLPRHIAPGYHLTSSFPSILPEKWV